VVIDPFNQLTNDYGKAGGRSDKYLETFLSDCTRFAQQNNIYFMIIAHPTKQRKDERGNYPCPDVFDIADGAMWNNKMDNITVYHRQFAQTDPSSPVAEFHSKKIKKKSVGRKGFIMVEYIWDRRRFFIEGRDFIQEMLNKKGLDFWKRKEANQSWLPYKDEEGGEVIF
jgi:hypothetical protein